MMEDVVERLREFVEHEARSCSMDSGCITPLYLQDVGWTVLNRGNRKGTDGNTETGIYGIKDNSYGQQAVAVCR